MRYALFRRWVFTMAGLAGAQMAACRSPPNTPPIRCPDPSAGSEGMFCSDDQQCSPATACRPIAGGGSSTCQTAYFPRVPSDILVTGFGVSEFELQPEAGPPTIFGWNAPEEAKRVVCGLFVAEPEISGGDERRISNDFKSLFRTHVFTLPKIPAGTVFMTRFTLSDLSTPPDHACPSSTSFGDPISSVGYPVVTMLQVACWAFDDVRIVAATRLHNLKLTDLPEIRPPVADCSNLVDENPSGRLCLLAPMVGACRGGLCASRSMTDVGAPKGLAPGEDGADGGGGVTPVATCDMAAESLPCQLGSRFQFGRCVGNRCADQEIGEADLPLVTADCERPGNTDWLNCFDDQVQGYGTCYDRRCRLRCTGDDDCNTVGAFLGVQSGSPALRCGKYDPVRKAPCWSTAGRKSVGLCLTEVPDTCR